MIHIEIDVNPPTMLSQNKDKWTRELLDSIDIYKGYGNIPKSIKDTIWTHYKHKDIREKLFASSYHKCAYCEAKPAESGNIEVEHFRPKSIYPELAFEWTNLLPICRKCNDSKSDYDTGENPIVNPSKMDPEAIFTYKYLNIVPLDDGDEKAKRTIEVCNLNSERLYDIRARLMYSLCTNEKAVANWIEEIREADTDRKRIVRINRLKDALDVLMKLTEPSEPYAGFCRDFLKNSKVYQEANRIIESGGENQG